MNQNKASVKKYKRLTIDKLSYDGCLNFLEAYVKYVSDEYVSIYNKYIHDPKNIQISKCYRKYRRYLLSCEFGLLTGLDGTVVVQGLENMVNNNITKRWDCCGTVL